MTLVSKQCGASSASVNWTFSNWKKIESDVFRLQMRIAKAARENRSKKSQTPSRFFKTIKGASTLSFNFLLIE